MNIRIALGSALLLVPAGLLAAQAPKNAAPKSAATGPQALEVDSNHSSVVFRVKHMGVSWFYGRFNQVKGQLTFNEDKPSESQVELEIQVESVDTGNKKRDDHLRSPDFFSAAEFPSIQFKSKSVKKDKEAYKVDGELSLHGVTKPLSVEVEKTGAGDTPRGYLAGFETTFTIKRSEFGMDFMLDGLSDEVRITASLECARK